MNKPRLSLSPSESSRWTRCTASPALIADNQDRLPPKDTSYNIEGTKAHLVADHVIREEPLPKGYDLESESVKEMLSNAEAFREFILDYANLFDEYTIKTEQKIPLWYQKQRHGYVDVVIITEEDLFVFDYKYGAGVEVSAVKNTQMAIYAMSYLKNKMPWFHGRITMGIYQPRLYKDKNPEIWNVSYAELEQFCQDEIQIYIDNILAGEVEYAPNDDTCRFCPAVAFCSKRAQQLLDIVPEGDYGLVTPVDDLSFDTMEAIIQNESLITKYIAEVRRRVFHMAEKGEAPGWKIVAGRKGNRAWSDEEKAKERLLQLIQQRALKTSLISPTEAERLLSSEQYKSIADLIKRSDGNPTLAREEDPRPALQVKPTEEFDYLLE